MGVLRLFLFVWLAFVAATFASEDDCPVCGKHFGKTIYRYTRVGYKEKVLICDQCIKLDTVCYVCRLPVVRNHTTCSDGRLICEEDARRAVMDQFTAGKLFDNAKVWCHSLFARYGALPHHNIDVFLEQKPQLDRTGNLVSDHPGLQLMGLTKSLRSVDGKQYHAIALLHGLTDERFRCVAIHEYAHAWLHENMPTSRLIHASTVEGFCEWLAHKYATEHRLEHEILNIEKNLYTRGQVHAFIAAEKEHGFYRVIQWTLHGVDGTLGDDMSRIAVLNKPVDTAPDFAAAPAFVPAPKRVGPDKLLLKGISGSAARRFALINDQTLMAGEQGKVRVGTSNVVVKCVAIKEKSVVVQVAGLAGNVELVLGAQ